jgi:ABC-type amino acid transport substrate-binding protein
MELKRMKLIIFLALFISNILAYGGQIVIGAIRVAPPFSQEIGSSNHYFGFCVDLIQEICNRLKDTCQYKGTDLDTQLNDLEQGVFDLTFSPTPINPTDYNNYIYSLPYIPSKGQFVTLNDYGIRSIEQLMGKKIGVLKASNLKEDVASRYTSLNNIYEYDQGTALINALYSHEVDSVLINSSVAKYMANNTITNLKMLGQPFDIGMGYGFIALKKNSDLINQINKILLQMESDGSYVALYNKYFGE